MYLYGSLGQFSAADYDELYRRQQARRAAVKPKQPLRSRSSMSSAEWEQLRQQLLHAFRG
jgi:hypothetical protein